MQRERKALDIEEKAKEKKPERYKRVQGQVPGGVQGEQSWWILKAKP